ncbi:hypothetical protein PG995_014254 [Apiospora arundinis]
MFWIIVIVFSLLLSHASAICYFPDGSVSAQDTPCDDASAEATCCGQGYVCLSNHICKASGDEIQRPGASLYVRGSCTDKLWRSSSCPNFCVDTAAPNFDFTSGGNGMDRCPSKTEDMYYCINHNVGNVDCEKKLNIVSFRGTPRELTTIGRAATTSFAASTSSKSLSTSTTLWTTSTSTPSGLSPAASSTTTPLAPQQQQPDADAQKQPGISAGAIIGASVGGSAAVAACALAGLLWYRRKRKVPPRDPHLSQQPAYSAAYHVPPETREDMSRYNNNYDHFDVRKGPGVQELPGSHSRAGAYNHAPQPGPFELPHN